MVYWQTTFYQGGHKWTIWGCNKDSSLVPELKPHLKNLGGAVNINIYIVVWPLIIDEKQGADRVKGLDRLVFLRLHLP